MAEESIWLESHRVETAPEIGIEDGSLYGFMGWRRILFSSMLREEIMSDKKLRSMDKKMFGPPPVVYPYVFTGPAGFGKHTLESAYAGTVCRSEKYQLFELPESDLIGGNAAGTCENLWSFFTELSRYTSVLEDAVSVDEETGVKKLNYFCFVKFGSMDTIFSKKKTALCFAECLKWLRRKKGSFILTACSEDDAGIHPALRNEAMVLRLRVPNQDERKEMLSDYLENHSFLRIGSSSDANELVKLTEGLSFGQLSTLQRMVLLLYKGKFMELYPDLSFSEMKNNTVGLTIETAELEELLQTLSQAQPQAQPAVIPQTLNYQMMGQYLPILGNMPFQNEKEQTTQEVSQKNDDDRIDSSILDDDDLQLVF